MVFPQVNGLAYPQTVNNLHMYYLQQRQGVFQITAACVFEETYQSHLKLSDLGKNLLAGAGLA